jgi:hypothetical protein
MDRYRIDRTWILSWEAPRDEWDPEYAHVNPDPDEGGPISFSRCRRSAKKIPPASYRVTRPIPGGPTPWTGWLSPSTPGACGCAAS